MQVIDYNPAVAIAFAAETVGGFFCAAGVLIGLVLMGSGPLQGLMGFAMGLGTTLPTLGGGLLLIVAGQILRATTTNSNTQAEPPRKKD